MKSINKKLCRNNEAVSEVIGGLLLITIVAIFMTSLMLMSTNYIEAQKNIANSTIEACQRFIDSLNDKFQNDPPVISDPHPTPGETNVNETPICSVFISDEDDSQLFVTFFFYSSGDSVTTAQGYIDYSLIVENNTIAKCPDSLATSPLTVYSWKVSVSDGHQTINSDPYPYYFTTKAANPSNAPPQILVPIWPKDNVTVQWPPQPYLWVNDPDRDSLTVNFYLMRVPTPYLPGVGWYEGSVTNINTLHGAVNVSHNLVLPDSDPGSTQYFWYVTVTDGINSVSSNPYYFFTPPAGS